MAQRQFRSDDTSQWSDKFGNSSDGAYAPSTGTDAPIDSACTGTINTTSLSATNGSFATGQLILIHQTQGTGAGQWELNKIASYTAGTITTSYSLIYGYVSGAQVLVMPQYSSGSIAGGVTLTGKAWNGTVGGIYAKFCNGTFTIAGALNVNGLIGGASAGPPSTAGGQGIGSLGGLATNNQTSSAAQGYQGGGTTGGGSASTAANGTGGGGGSAGAGSNATGGGGGGGHAASGTGGGSAGDAAHTGGTGGGTGGAAGLTTMIFGGAGGGAGLSDGSSHGASGSGGGGGIVLIIAKTITVTGTISTTGGSSPAADFVSGGGGAGGSVLLKGQVLTLGTTLITSAAGSAGAGGRSSGGAGSAGRIHADYLTSISGTTNPTIDSRQDTSLVDAGGGSFLFNFI